MTDSHAPRPVGAAKKAGNRRALIFLAAGLVLLLVAYAGTHVLNNNSGKSASASIRASITTATTAPHRTSTGIVLKPRTVTDPGPAPSATRDPFSHP